MILRHLLSILALPTVVAVVVPYLLLSSPSRPSPAGSPLLRAAALLAGLCLLGIGLVLVGSTIRHFARIGRGTLAPWDPPRRLVVAGVYRHVRNPMISGVLLVLLGEALAFFSPELLAWAAVFFAINATYIPLIEEPVLARRFGEDYREYRRHVPRWLPRWTAWEPPPSRLIGEVT
jgi:protein-S-isoprenylcysteine O-methyltransferase Ste14